MRKCFSSFVAWLLAFVMLFSMVKAYWLWARVAGILVLIWIVLSVWQRERSVFALFLTIYMMITLWILLWLSPTGIVGPIWSLILAFVTPVVSLWWHSRIKKKTS